MFAGSALTAVLNFLLLGPEEAAGLSLARMAAAAVLQRVQGQLRMGSLDVSKTDAGRWAAAFVESSFGDPLLAMALSLLLCAAAPADVRVSSCALCAVHE